MEGHRLWRRASEEEREREGVCEWIFRTVLDEQRHWQLLSLSVCLSRPLSLSRSLSKYQYFSIWLLFISREDFLWSPVYTKQSLDWLGFLSTVYTPPPPSCGSTWGTEWEQGCWSALWFSASRWWMWKIPVRGPNAASLKPGDLYTGKGIQKAGEEKTYYTLCSQMWMCCVIFIYLIDYVISSSF